MWVCGGDAFARAVIAIGRDTGLCVPNLRLECGTVGDLSPVHHMRKVAVDVTV